MPVYASALFTVEASDTYSFIFVCLSLCFHGFLLTPLLEKCLLVLIESHGYLRKNGGNPLADEGVGTFQRNCTTGTKVTPLRHMSAVTGRYGCKGTAETSVSLAVPWEAHKGFPLRTGGRRNTHKGRCNQLDVPMLRVQITLGSSM
jgi:hypothetical protein